MNYFIKDVAFAPGRTTYTIAKGEKVVGVVHRDNSSGALTQPGEDGKASQPAHPLLQKVIREHVAALYTQGDY